MMGKKEHVPVGEDEHAATVQSELTPDSGADRAETRTSAAAAAAPGAACGAEPDDNGKSIRKGRKTRKDKEKEKHDELYDRHLRLRADFDNFRSRTLREKSELYRRANMDLVEQLLPVLDHMTLAIEAAEQHDPQGTLVEGFKLVAEQLQNALGRFGLTPLDAEGETFDPNKHEAISHLPSADVPEDKVILQLRRGYMFGDRLLRAAQVTVSSGAGPVTEESGQSER